MKLIKKWGTDGNVALLIKDSYVCSIVQNMERTTGVEKNLCELISKEDTPQSPFLKLTKLDFST